MPSRLPRVGVNPGGFSLVELIVVIAIVSLLFALTFPALRAARESGRRTACKDNLRGIGISLYEYLDGNGCFPEAAVEPTTDNPLNLPSLAEALSMTRTPRLFQCPDDFYRRQDAVAVMARAGLSSLPTSYFALEGTSYAYEMIVSGRTPVQLLAAGLESSEIMASADFAPFHGATDHNGSQNFLYVDGHVDCTTVASTGF
ncbi:MAG TPA: DUF1559 domain-containing protein [Phycisphaerae bacterium]|nr:DUF1559 domain-containing protein [Phycisphaerae bacterium]